MHIKFNSEYSSHFMAHFLDPVVDLFNNGVIEKPANSSAKNRQRKQILEQGRTDFDSPSSGLTAEQKVELYCYHYFLMHLSSNLAFMLFEKDFLLNLFNENNIVYFVDIGCGPLTAGIALNRWLKENIPGQKKVSYYGADISKSMIKKANSLLTNPHFFEEFSEVELFDDKARIVEHLSSREITEKSVFIINYSFLFASHSLIVQEFVDFTNNLIENTPKTIILYQNPGRSDLSKKWIEYKKNLTSFSSKKQYPLVYRYKYDDIFGSSNYPSPTLKAKFDILKNFQDD